MSYPRESGDTGGEKPNKEPKGSKEPHERPEHTDREKPEQKGIFDRSRPTATERAVYGSGKSNQSEKIGAGENSDRGGLRAAFAEAKAILDAAEKGARDYICREAFNAKFGPSKEPVEHEFERDPVERTLDWTGLDSFMSTKPVGDWGQFRQDAVDAYHEFQKLHEQMLNESKNKEGKTVNIPDRDKYYHCMANCIGNSHGPGGEIASAAASAAKEVKDVMKVMICRDWSYGAATRDSSKDQAANRVGRDAGRSGLRCSDACAADRLQFTKFMYR